jgi:hypothetical protein
VLPAGTRWEERNKATIRGFCLRPRDADHVATGKRPFPCNLGRDGLPDQRERSRMRRREFIAGLGSVAGWPVVARARRLWAFPGASGSPTSRD